MFSVFFLSEAKSPPTIFLPPHAYSRLDSCICALCPASAALQSAIHANIHAFSDIAPFENRIKNYNKQLFPDFPSIPFCVPSWLNVSKEKSTFPPCLLCNTNFVVDRFLCLLPPPEGQLQEDKDLICPVYHYEDSNWHSTFSIYGQKRAQLTFLIW